MKERLNIRDLVPEAAKAMYALEKAVSQPIEPKLYLLIKLRASVINGCAYCVDMHATDALKGGEAARRIFAVSAWRESPFFTDRERAVFAFTDEVTRLGEHGVTDGVWNAAKEALGSDKAVAEVLMAVVAINAWNRIAVPTHLQPPPLRVADA